MAAARPLPTQADARQQPMVELVAQGGPFADADDGDFHIQMLGQDLGVGAVHSGIAELIDQLEAQPLWADCNGMTPL